MSDKSFHDRFHDYVSLMIDEKGIWPAPAMATMGDGQCDIASIDDAKLVFRWFWDYVLKTDATEVIFGLDRWTAPGQGTELPDVLVCVYWRKDSPNSIAIGTIEYQFEPRIVKPWDWQNEFWTGKAYSEVVKTCPSLRFAKIIGAVR